MVLLDGSSLSLSLSFYFSVTISALFQNSNTSLFTLSLCLPPSHNFIPFHSLPPARSLSLSIALSLALLLLSPYLLPRSPYLYRSVALSLCFSAYFSLPFSLSPFLSFSLSTYISLSLPLCPSLSQSHKPCTMSFSLRLSTLNSSILFYNSIEINRAQLFNSREPMELADLKSHFECIPCSTFKLQVVYLLRVYFIFYIFIKCEVNWEKRERTNTVICNRLPETAKQHHYISSSKKKEEKKKKDKQLDDPARNCRLLPNNWMQCPIHSVSLSVSHSVSHSVSRSLSHSHSPVTARKSGS